MIDVYGINTCVWYLCYFFHAFFCCFLPVQSMCVFSLVFTSSTAQAAFKGSSVQSRAFTTTLLYGLLLTMCNGGPHQQVNDLATLRSYSQKADYSL